MKKRSAYDERAGARLRMVRKAAGKSQKEVCMELEVEPYEMSRWENGRAKFPFKVALEMAKKRGISIMVLDPAMPLDEDQLLMLLRQAVKEADPVAE